MGSGCGKAIVKETLPKPPGALDAKKDEDGGLSSPANASVQDSHSVSPQITGDVVREAASGKMTDAVSEKEKEAASTTTQEARPDTPQEASPGEGLRTATVPAPHVDDDLSDIVESVTPAPLHETHPPVALPRLTSEMRLIDWLRLILTPEAGSSIDQFTLLSAYHHLSEPPHVENEVLIRIVRRLFSGTAELDDGAKLLVTQIRWVTAGEVADLIDAGYEHGSPHRPGEDAAGVETAQGPPAMDASTANSGYDAAVSPPPPPPGEPTDPATTATVPTSIDEILASRPKRDYDREFEKLKASASYNPIVKWLKEVLTEDEGSVADPNDIGHALSALEGANGTHPSVDAAVLQRVLCDVFPAAKLFEYDRAGSDGVAEDTNFVRGLKWAKLATSTYSVAILHDTFPEKRRNEAHKLLHVPDPTRTRLWLRSTFTCNPKFSLGLQSMWSLYERVHWRWTDTHNHREGAEFTELILKAFKKCELLEVSQNYHVVLGLHVRPKQIPAKQILARKHKHDLRRMQEAGEIDIPQTTFAQKLLQDPLLMRVREDEQNRPIPGSYVQRTRRRGGDPETREKEPFGDEEPGFPGLSMKREQVRFKRELQEYTKKMAEMQKEADKAAGLPLPDPNQPRGGITYVD